MSAGGKVLGFGTRAIHAGQSPDPVTGAVMTPIYMTSTYAQEGPGAGRYNGAAPISRCPHSLTGPSELQGSSVGDRRRWRLPMIVRPHTWTMNGRQYRCP